MKEQGHRRKQPGQTSTKKKAQNFTEVPKLFTEVSLNPLSTSQKLRYFGTSVFYPHPHGSMVTGLTMIPSGFGGNMM